MLVALLLAAPAHAWEPPNALVGVGIGAPWGVSVRGEAFLAEQVSGELGVGLNDFSLDTPMADWALRWRPDLVCFGCDQKLQASLGIGIGGTVRVDPEEGFAGTWSLGVGPDLVASGVYWFSSNAGLQLTGRVGFGPTLLTDGFAVDVVEPWAMISAGLAF